MDIAQSRRKENIAEQGTHDELIARGGIYAKLIEMQSLK